jgi:eukaryotic-like serine/threonine-protein kinase
VKSGQTIAHYTILDKLGDGGMGVVYKAEDTRLQRIVALKLLPPELTRDPEAKERLLREAQAASALQHHNICTIHEIGETDDGEMFFCMDYYEGETLKERLLRLQVKNELPIPVSEVLDIGIQIAEGLAKAHEKGIIHRDIKPANIMVTNDGAVKILDFGLAKLAGQAKITQTGKALGTIDYLSPEQAEGKNVDHRTDIWSLGVVLYEMCTSMRPFERDSDAAVIYAILDKSPVAPSDMGVNIPDDLERVIFNCMEKNPKDRYQTVQDLLSDLVEIKKRYTYTEESSTKRKYRITRTGIRWNDHNVRKRTILIVSSVIILALCCVFLLPQLFHSSKKIESIAVLPFDNLSNDREQEYFVSGIHEELLTNLSKIKALRVISKTSVMQFEKTTKTASEIARELNVDALIEGSVMRAEGQVRINVQLIDGSTDKHLWAESYDRDSKNILKMLSEVAQTIAEEIKIAVTSQEKDRIAAVHFVKPEVHEEYLKGRYLTLRFDSTGFPAALTHFRTSTEIDPNFAPGYSGQASVYFLMGYFGMKPHSEVIPNARMMAMKALEIDEGLGEAHTVLSWIKLSYDWDWPGAAKEAQRALELNPNDAIARHAYGDYLMFIMGQVEEGLHQVMIARDIDPLSPSSVIPAIYHLQLVHQYDKMIDECRKLLATDPNYPGARGTLRDALWLNGNYEEAFIEFQKTWNWNDALKGALKHGYRVSGPKGAVRELASTFAKQSIPFTGSVLGVATLYAFAGDKDSTFVWLEKAYAEHTADLFNIHGSPTYDFLRFDPRFQSLLRRIGIPETEKGRSE